MEEKNDKTKPGENLNPKQKLFCEYYVSKDFFGNGVQSYLEVYSGEAEEEITYDTAKSNAHRLLTNAYILEYINSMLDEAGLNDAFVDKQLLFLINQNAEFPSKIAAIKEYNKLKQRIVEKSELVVKKKDLSNFTDDELRAAKEIADKIGD